VTVEITEAHPYDLVGRIVNDPARAGGYDPVGTGRRSSAD